MIIKSVKLENIRSYINQEIFFPDGSTLLSGDIGSGKSTILLAIEFALFGIIRGSLSGNSLLRNGKRTGSVELNFEIDGNQLTIKRSLKRSNDNVSQDSGYIIRNGLKKEGTAVELKSEIINLLGYPKDLIAKSKTLIYRYTVYTPQEEMKRILMENKEDRLNTLRKVFDIDKYKRIRENISVYTRELRERKKLYEGRISDLDMKIKQRDEKLKENSEITSQITTLTPLLEQAKEKTKQAKDRVAKQEGSVANLIKLKQEIESLAFHLKSKVNERVRNNAEIENLKRQIFELEKELPPAQPQESTLSIRLDLKETEKSIGLIESKIKEINSKSKEFEVKIDHSNYIKDKIDKLSKCPVCLQDVTDEHKKAVCGREEADIISLNELYKINKDRLVIEEKKIAELKDKKEALIKKEKEFEIKRIKTQNIEEKRKRLDILSAQQEDIKNEVGKINRRKMDICTELELSKDAGEFYIKLKKEMFDIIEQEKDIELHYISLTKEKEGIQKLLLLIEKEIEQKQESRKELERIKNIHDWVDDFFIKLVGTIEKQVMAKVYNEFNGLFQNWFNMMISDDAINARLDDTFTPIITQNGYETDLAHMSGGERTSCALAYRLALNKVINDITSTVKTKDLLILDEPTDGFSTDQLDKVRDILDELNLKQVIIVSHEAKIESFVDTVIRVVKADHVSRVVV